MSRAKVLLFKPSGKYYTEETWEIPALCMGPYDMAKSPDFRRIDGGAVLVETQEPWGYPHLFPSPLPSLDSPALRQRLDDLVWATHTHHEPLGPDDTEVFLEAVRAHLRGEL